MIKELLHAIEVRQAEIRLSLALGNAADHASYMRMVGEYQGLTWVLDTLNAKLADND